MTDKKEEKPEPLFTADHIAALMRQMNVGSQAKPKREKTDRQKAATEGRKLLFAQARELGIELTKENQFSKTGRSPKTLSDLRAEITAKDVKPDY